MANGLAKGVQRKLGLTLCVAVVATGLAVGLPARAGETTGETAWAAIGFETGDFFGFSAASAQAGSFTISTGHIYGGDFSGLATYAGGDVSGYARAVFNVDVGSNKDLWYGAAFYLPPGFKQRQGGDIELLRWDNVPSRGNGADSGGIVLSGSDHRASLFKRSGLDGPRETLLAPFDVPEGRWFFLEIRQRLSQSDPLNEIYLDGERLGRSNQQNSFGRPAERLRYGLVTIDQLQPAQLWVDRIIARMAAPGSDCDWSVTSSLRYSDDSYLPRVKYQRRWPVGCWRPYSDASPFNQRIPADARVDPNSALMVKRLTDAGDPSPRRAGTADTSSDFFKPTYWASRSDPLVRLNGSSSSPIDGEMIRVPQGARPAGGSDHHMTIVQPDGWEYDLWNAQPVQNGVLNYDSGRSISVEGDGLNSAATASRFGNMAGQVRAQELEEGHVNHALFMAASTIASNAVYPAALNPGGIFCGI